MKTRAQALLCNDIPKDVTGGPQGVVKKLKLKISCEGKVRYRSIASTSAPTQSQEETRPKEGLKIILKRKAPADGKIETSPVIRKHKRSKVGLDNGLNKKARSGKRRPANKSERGASGIIISSSGKDKTKTTHALVDIPTAQPIQDAVNGKTENGICEVSISSSRDCVADSKARPIVIEPQTGGTASGQLCSVNTEIVTDIYGSINPVVTLPSVNPSDTSISSEPSCSTGLIISASSLQGKGLPFSRFEDDLDATVESEQLQQMGTCVKSSALPSLHGMHVPEQVAAPKATRTPLAFPIAVAAAEPTLQAKRSPLPLPTPALPAVRSVPPVSLPLPAPPGVRSALPPSLSAPPAVRSALPLPPPCSEVNETELGLQVAVSPKVIDAIDVEGPAMEVDTHGFSSATLGADMFLQLGKEVSCDPVELSGIQLSEEDDSWAEEDMISPGMFTEGTWHDTDTSSSCPSALQETRKKGGPGSRAVYRCSRCLAPKKGHKCPFDSEVATEHRDEQKSPVTTETALTPKRIHKIPDPNELFAQKVQGSPKKPIHVLSVETSKKEQNDVPANENKRNKRSVNALLTDILKKGDKCLGDILGKAAGKIDKTTSSDNKVGISAKTETSFSSGKPEKTGLSLKIERTGPSVKLEETGFSVLKVENTEISHESGNVHNTNLKLKVSSETLLKEFSISSKWLLETGVLEGYTVRYMPRPGEALGSGVVQNGGILCSCRQCKGLQSFNASSFEKHVGSTARHPSDFLFLDNGRCLREVLEAGSRHKDKADMMNALRAAVSLERKTTDLEVCTECGEGGNVIVRCSRKGCFNRYHQECAHITHTIVKGWSCPGCLQSDEGVSPKSRYSNNPTVSSASRLKDINSHKALFAPGGLPDGTKLGYYIKGQCYMSGVKQGSGISCSCCNQSLSCSQFELHAGWGSRRNPYNSIYLTDGRSLHEVALSLPAQGRCCLKCGQEGILVHCNSCSGAYHKECRESHDISESDWVCSQCGDSKVGRRLMQIRPEETTLCGCALCQSPDFEKGGFGAMTIMLCDQCEREFHVGCLKEHGLADLKELPEGEWFCGKECRHIRSILTLLVLDGEESVPKSIASKIKEGPVKDSLDLSWQLLHGSQAVTKDGKILSEALAIFSSCFVPIVDAVSGQNLIPLMVYSRSIRDQEFGGMYCMVLKDSGKVVSAAMLRIFGKPLAEMPLAATSKERQGMGYFQALLGCIERLLGILSVEQISVPAADGAEGIWSNKFAFSQMPEGQLQKFRKELQMMFFAGSSVLKKDITPLPGFPMGD